MNDRPFPHDPLLDGPAEPPAPRPERNPDDARESQEERDRLNREWADATRAALLYSRCHIEHLHDPRG